MKIIFGFHFNQPYTPYLRIVLKASYIPLIRILLKYNIKATLNISGITILGCKQLGKHGEKFLNIVKTGINLGLFKLCASTFASEMPAALSENELIKSIYEHIYILNSTFGIKPDTFWNSERVFTKKIIPALKLYSLKYSFIEQQMLSLKYRHHPVNIDDIIFFEDSRVFKWKVDEWIRNGKTSKLRYYLYKASKNFQLSYFEDAECFRIWNMEDRKKSSVFDFENLLSLLDYLKKKITFIHSKDFSGKIISIETPHAKQSFWLKNSFEKISPARFYENDNYKNWFDFFNNSADILYFKGLSSIAKEYIKEMIKDSDNPFSKAIINISKQIYYSARFEFGCPGLLKPGKEMFENIRIVYFMNFILKQYKKMNNCIIKGDFLKDGRELYLFISEKYACLVDEKAEIEFLIKFYPLNFLIGSPLFSTFLGNYFSKSKKIDLLTEHCFIAYKKSIKLIRPNSFLFKKSLEKLDISIINNKLSYKLKQGVVTYLFNKDNIVLNLKLNNNNLLIFPKNISNKKLPIMSNYNIIYVNKYIPGGIKIELIFKAD